MNVAGGFRLAIDLGTCHTVAVARRDGQPPRAVLLDGSPTLPSGVFVAGDGSLHTGRDAARLALAEPDRFEPHPKRRVDEGTVLLGASELPVPALLAAVLRRVAHEAWQGGVDATDATVLTYPAGWGAQRRGVLEEAARRAGLGRVTLVAEPVAAATYCMEVLGERIPASRSLAVFDFGGGTLDLTLVRRDAGQLRILATGGLPDLGGLDLDAALVNHLGPLVAARDPQLWRRLDNPADAVDLRERSAFWAEVRAAKEMLSRTATAPVALPRSPAALHLTRDELEAVAGPLIDRAVAEAGRLLTRCGLAGPDLAGMLLVGGSSRVPLVASRLHSRLGVAPTVPEQPELPVAHGALLAAGATTGPVVVGPLTASPAAVGAPVDDPVWPSPPPVPPAAVAPPVASPRRRAVAVGTGVALVAALAAATVLASQLGLTDRDGTLAGETPGTGGNAVSPGGLTVPGTDDVVAPEGFTRCDEVLCPTTAMCWGGLTSTSGRSVEPRELDCSEPHTWQTFAAGQLSTEALDGDHDELMLDRPEVAEVCTEALLADRSLDPARTDGWRIEAWPFQADAETWVFHCLATPVGGESTESRIRSGAG